MDELIPAKAWLVRYDVGCQDLGRAQPCSLRNLKVR
jgi:hypothetical protein